MSDYRITYHPGYDAPSLVAQAHQSWGTSYALEKISQGYARREYWAERRVTTWFGYSSKWVAFCTCESEKRAEEKIREQAIKDYGGEVIAEFARNDIAFQRG